MVPTITPAQERRFLEVKEFEKSDLYMEKYEPLMVYFRTNCPSSKQSSTGPEIIERLQLGDNKNLRLLVRHARMCHIPIASGGTGYWLASSWEEYRKVIASMVSRRNSLSELIFEMEQCFPDQAQGKLLEPSGMEFPEEFEGVRKFCRHYCHRNRGMADYGIPNVFTVEKVRAGIGKYCRNLVGNNAKLDEILSNTNEFIPVGKILCGSFGKLNIFTIPEYLNSVKSFFPTEEGGNG